jgi:hypothetical protein
MTETTKNASQKNREDLGEWYASSGCTDIKFWIPPSVVASKEECELEVLNAVKAFDADVDKQPATDLAL